MDKKAIIRNFSRCAHLYDRYSDVQEETARQLLGTIHKDSFANILEVGCGTGNYTRLLRGRFPEAKITALDISGRMIDVARNKLGPGNIEFIVNDAEKAVINEKFGLITSNACLQWLDDPGAAIAKYKRLLKPSGVISFSVFGPLTYRELNSAMAGVLGGTTVPASGFIDKEAMGEMLLRNFKEISIKERVIKESLPDLKKLLDKIKYTGVRGDTGREGRIFTAGILKKLEEEYLKIHKKINVTYQVFYYSAEDP